MAWPKAKRARRPSRKLLTAGAANRKFARKRRNWIGALNTTCSEICFGPEYDLETAAYKCPSSGLIVLMSQQELREHQGDSIRIARILADYYISPFPTQPPAGVITDVQLALRNMVKMTYLRVGLKKSEVSEADQAVGGSPIFLNPMGTLLGASTPDAFDDFIDGRFMHVWEHMWGPGAQYAMQSSGGGCCSVQSSYEIEIPPIVAGESIGATNVVPAITCQPCPLDPDAAHAVVHFGGAFVKPMWHLHIDWKKPIQLRENERLDLMLGWSSTFPCALPDQQIQPVANGSNSVPQDILRVRGGARLLTEE